MVDPEPGTRNRKPKMHYYKLLQLDREPFGNSPDPDFFFHSYQHQACLQKLELALRLKRGLNVVIGDVGTGKTTLCRQLIRKLSAEPEFETHLVLDPSFNSPIDFLRNIAGFICNRHPDEGFSEIDLKEQIKHYLFLKGVDQGKTIVLIIDEGQKTSRLCLEILRELLNYETNSYKLLQIIIFAQLEFQTVLDDLANFSDRINLLHYLKPLNFSDTRQLIHHRIKLSSTRANPQNIFTLPALWTIYRASRGYPRKIINICHQSILALIIQNRTRAGRALIRSCIKRLTLRTRSERAILAAIVVVLASAAALNIFAVFFMRPESGMQLSKPFKIPTARQNVEVLPLTPVNKNFSVPNDTEPFGVPSGPMSPEPPPAVGTPAVAMIDTPSETAAPPANATDDFAQRRVETAPPLVLGQLIVRPGDTLYHMIHRVYGAFRKNCLSTVIAANPHIADPDDINPGNIIKFPSVDFLLDRQSPPFFIIAFDEQPSLTAAMQRQQMLLEEIQLPVRVISSWSPASGLRFHLVLTGYFNSNETANSYLRLLPAQTSGQATIISNWSHKTVFFSDPYGGGLRLSPSTVRTEIEK
jgi:general secretion pathway protein A